MGQCFPFCPYYFLDRGADPSGILIMQSKAFAQLLKEKNPDDIFDLVCAAMWFSGNLDQNIPVDDAREVFAHIKKLVLKCPTRKVLKSVRKK